MDIERRCAWCGKSFVAHNFGTRYCSEECKRAAYRSRKRAVRKEKHEGSNIPDVGMIGDKKYLSAKDVAILLDTTTTSIYRYIHQGVLKCFKFSANKIVIRRSDLDALFDNAPAFKKKYGRNVKSDYYTMQQIMSKYGISRKAAMSWIKKYNIPIAYEGRNTFFPKSQIDEKFGGLKDEISKSDFYTIAEIMEKYNMSHAAVLSFVQRHNIPRKTVLRKVYYSREDVDKHKDPNQHDDVEYYTYLQIEEKFGFTKDQVTYYVHTYHVSTIKRGKFTLISKKEFDSVIKWRVGGGEVIENDMSDDSTIESLMDRKKQEQDAKIPKGYLSTQQIAEKYSLSISHVQKLTRDFDIKDKRVIGGFNYFPEAAVTEAFNKYEQHNDVKLWISAKEMEEKYMMTPEARRSFAYRHKIPSKLLHGKVYYAKADIEKVKSEDFEGRENYYSVEEIMEKYGLTKWAVYNKVKYYKIRKVHKAQFSYFPKEDVDRILGKKDDEMSLI